MNNSPQKRCLWSGSTRSCGIAILALSLVGSQAATGVLAQTPCRPPKDLLVCQDTYGPSGRVYLEWTNGEATYSSVRVYVDGVLEGEAPGATRSGYVPGLSTGVHLFEVEGLCASGPSARLSRTYELVTTTPHAEPAADFACDFDAAASRLTVTWALGARKSLFTDVYLRRDGVIGLSYVTSILGDKTSFVLPGARAGDRLSFQFFDEGCYGSPLVGCPSAGCSPPPQIRVCQDLYGAAPRLFVIWSAGADDITRFEVFVDGEQRGEAEGRRRLAYLSGVPPGLHTIGVRSVCASGPSGITEEVFDVLTSSPHAEPIESLRCKLDLERKETVATWLPGAAPSDFVDVYVRTPGVALLDFRGTILGDRTRVEVPGTEPGEEVVLQFFNNACYGSPLITCGDAPGSGELLRGDSNGSATVDLTDSIFTLSFLFLGGPRPLCPDAADSNDDGALDITDPVFVLTWLFSGGPPPPAPGPLSCGPDPTPDALAACLTPACP